VSARARASGGRTGNVHGLRPRLPPPRPRRTEGAGAACRFRRGADAGGAGGPTADGADADAGTGRAAEGDKGTRTCGKTPVFKRLTACAPRTRIGLPIADFRSVRADGKQAKGPPARWLVSGGFDYVVVGVSEDVSPSSAPGSSSASPSALVADDDRRRWPRSSFDGRIPYHSFRP
jgi:hypothetical protein